MSTTFPTALLHFLLGVVLFVTNLVLLVASFADRKLRTGSYYLSANLWFANCLLGAAMTIDNVVAVDRTVERSPLVSTQGTAALLNSLATLATLLALSTARLVWYRQPHQRVTAWSALKISFVMWTAIGILILVKTIAFSALSRSFYDGRPTEGVVCLRCLFGFETAILSTFVVANVLLYVVTLYLVVSRTVSTVHDSQRVSATMYAREARASITAGLWLLFHFVSFTFLAMLLVGQTFSEEPLRPMRPIVSALLACYSLHGLINPLVAILRDADMTAAVRRLISCDRIRSSGHERTDCSGQGPMPVGDPPPPYTSPIDSAANSLMDQP